jgi:hypothetical protein
MTHDVSRAGQLRAQDDIEISRIQFDDHQIRAIQFATVTTYQRYTRDQIERVNFARCYLPIWKSRWRRKLT